MSQQDRWLLPEGIEEVLPAEARRLERLRRQILDLADSWGYDLVMPPLVEYLESLLTGVGEQMDLQTFKVTDQLSGRMMGIRPDMTPQAARIDAHYLKKENPVRLCYLGPVLRTRPGVFAGSREPLQFGAELFGDDGRESELEIMLLMLAVLDQVGMTEIHLDLGHVGVYRGLIASLDLDAGQQADLFNAIQIKAKADMRELMKEWQLPSRAQSDLLALVDFNGGEEVLTEAARCYKKNKQVVEAISQLKQSSENLVRLRPQQTLYYDLAELTGYGYYTGLTFAAFVQRKGQAIAQGGRYDGIGRAFGRERPATGFGTDLRSLIRAVGTTLDEARGILAPVGTEPGLSEKIRQLRAQGERVVQQLGNQEQEAKDLNCDRRLVLRDGNWQIEEI